MATPTYIEADGAARGIASAETGINIGSYSESFDNPKDYLLDRWGGRQPGFATDFDKSSTASIEGETITSLDTVMGVAYATATTIANSITGYGVATGEYFMDSIEISQERESWTSASLEFTRIDGLTVTP